MKKSRKEKEPTSLSAELLSQAVAKGMQDKKAQNIVIMDMRHVKQAMADFFVICTGGSDTQLDAIADSIEKEVVEIGNEKPWHREGMQNREWILLDYVNVIAHVFKKTKRDFFALEELWADAKITQVASDN